MAPRRSSTRGGNSARPNTGRTPARIRKYTRSRQPPNRYSHPESLHNVQLAIPGEGTQDQTSDTDEMAPSTPNYSHSPDQSSNSVQLSRSPASQSPAATQQESPALLSESESLPLSPPSPYIPLNMDTMRELLRSYE